MSNRKHLAAIFTGAALLQVGAALAADTAEDRSFNELRNTVVNLLQGLVERGVLTREQAEAMVREAQSKAATDAGAKAAQDRAEADAVRVPYVPEIVRDEIRRQVASDLENTVAKRVAEQAAAEGWGVPAALPEWIQRVRLSGDVRVRTQIDTFASDNALSAYRDFLTINDRGGFNQAGAAQFINVSEDRQRLRARLRLGLEAELGFGWSFGARLATGNLRDPVSTNQSLGNTGARYQTGLDLAYARWYANSDTGKHTASAWFGRIPSPWTASDLIWDSDLTFEGVAANYRVALTRDDPYGRSVFLTLGAFPIEEVELSSKDKWLLGAQAGIDWKLRNGNRVRFAGAYYDFRNTVGRRNAVVDSTLLNFTAPRFLQRGNTLFDILNDNNPNSELFGLAAEYRIVSATAAFDWNFADGYRATLSADALENIGYEFDEVRQRNPNALEDPTRGYQIELNVGKVALLERNDWRAFVGYRYLEADATLDAFTDSDFRLGGTDSKGFYLGGDYALSRRIFVRVRYLSGNEIDGPPLGIDVLQVDLNAQF